jgi:hypothetical protein
MPLNACNIDDTRNSGKGLQAVVVDAGEGGLPMTHFAPVRLRPLLVFRQHRCNVLVGD